MNGKLTVSMVLLLILAGTGVLILPFGACRSDSSSATDPGDRSSHQSTVQTIDAAVECTPLYNTLPTTVKVCVTIDNLVDSPRVVDGRIDLWLGGGSPYYNWRFREVDLVPNGTWEQCWNNQVNDLQSLEEKNIVRLQVVDVTPPPYNQPPYPPSGATATDVAFFWGNSPAP